MELLQQKDNLPFVISPMNKWAADIAPTEADGCPGQSHIYLITIAQMQDDKDMSYS